MSDTTQAIQEPHWRELVRSTDGVMVNERQHGWLSAVWYHYHQTQNHSDYPGCQQPSRGLSPYLTKIWGGEWLKSWHRKCFWERGEWGVNYLNISEIIVASTPSPDLQFFCTNSYKNIQLLIKRNCLDRISPRNLFMVKYLLLQFCQGHP